MVPPSREWTARIEREVVVVLCELREAARLSKRRLALLAGLSPSQVGQVERGVNGYSFWFSQRIAEVLGVRLSVVIRRAERRVWKGK